MKDALLDTAPVVSSDVAASRVRSPDYTVYKPNARGCGGVIRFGYNAAKLSVFVDAASQSGEKQFDWDRKITMKWGLADLGQVLATLQGRQAEARLFHQSEKSNSAFELSAQEDAKKAPYLMSVSRQDGRDKSLRKVALPLAHAEAAVLETVLRVAISRIVKW